MRFNSLLNLIGFSGKAHRGSSVSGRVMTPEFRMQVRLSKLCARPISAHTYRSKPVKGEGTESEVFMSFPQHSRFMAAVLFLVLTIALAIAVSGVSADGDYDQVEAIPEKKQQKYPNLGSVLNQIVASVEEGRMPTEEGGGSASVSIGESVAVTIHLTTNVSGVVQFLQDSGGDPRNIGEDYIEAYVPVSLLGSLSQRPGVVRVREIVPPRPAQLTQRVVGNGPAVHGSLPWNSAGYSGQGIKVGVIDLGFKGMSSLQGFEIPSNIIARCYTSVGVFTSNLADCEAVKDVSTYWPDWPECLSPAQRRANDSAEHGTIVAESLLDIAPGVTLYIADPQSRGDMQATVDWMVAEGVQVINHSVGWIYDGPGDGTSPSSISPLNTVDRAVVGDILWINAAGNNAVDTWFGEYSDPDGNSFISFRGSAVNDELNNLPLRACRSYRVQLRWEDDWRGANTDLNIYLNNRITGQVHPTFKSVDPQSGQSGHDPFETFSFYSRDDSNQWGIVVEHHSGPAPDWIQVLAWSVDPLEVHAPSGSIGNPAESANQGLLAAGAAPWFDVNAIEFFSSQGPTPDRRTKPDIVGADCGQTALSPLRFSSRLGGNCGFPGTSQASPHVAGMAALVRQRFPNMPAVQVASYLKNNAERRGSVPNNTWGHGFAKLPDDVSRNVPPGPPPAADPCTQAITGDGEVSGTWATGCQSQVQGRGYARYYSFTLAQQSQVTIDLESSVDTYLYLRRGDATSGAFLYENDDIASGGVNVNSRIGETLAVGDYTIEATTYSTATTGSFTLTISGLAGTGSSQPPAQPPPAADPCTQAITGDGEVSGTWATGCQSQVQGRGYARYYSFTLAQQSQVTIDLESSVDTYLYLRRGDATSGAFLYENDDIASGGVNVNSRIGETLAVGDYTIEATTYSTATTGSFTLTISGLAGTGSSQPPAQPPPAADPCTQAITGDGEVSGTWATGCQSQVQGRGYARYYSFTLAQQSQVTIDLESSVDTYLYLRRGDATSGAFLYENDDIASGGVNVNSRIGETLAVGDYTIEATTYSTATTGSFTLTISGLAGTGSSQPPAQPPPAADPCTQAITGDGEVSGTWATGCQSQVQGRGYARYYSFTLAQQSQVTIDLESSVDTYLYLRRGDATSGAFLYENDDIASGGVNVNSRIGETLAVGDYTIEATTYSTATTGSFTLTISGLAGTGSGTSSDATLGALSVSGTAFWHPSFSPAATEYAVQVGIGTSETTVRGTANHWGASVVVKRRTSWGTWVDSYGSATVPLERGRNWVRVVVTAQDRAATKTYYMLITRTATPFPTLGELSSDDPPVNFRVTGFGHDSAGVQWEVPRGRHISKYELTRYEHDGSGFVYSWSVDGDISGGSSIGLSSINLKADTQYRYDLELMNDALIPIIEDSVTVRTAATD